jgi:hypothetical protein
MISQLIIPREQVLARVSACMILVQIAVLHFIRTLFYEPRNKLFSNPFLQTSARGAHVTAAGKTGKNIPQIVRGHALWSGTGNIVLQ